MLSEVYLPVGIQWPWVLHMQFGDSLVCVFSYIQVYKIVRLLYVNCHVYLNFMINNNIKWHKNEYEIAMKYLLLSKYREKLGKIKAIQLNKIGINYMVVAEAFHLELKYLYYHIQITLIDYINIHIFKVTLYLFLYACGFP